RYAQEFLTGSSSLLLLAIETRLSLQKTVKQSLRNAHCRQGFGRSRKNCSQQRGAASRGAARVPPGIGDLPERRSNGQVNGSATSAGILTWRLNFRLSGNRRCPIVLLPNFVAYSTKLGRRTRWVLTVHHRIVFLE